jgi:cell division protein DivIC
MRKRSSIFSSLGRLTPATTTMLAIIFVVIILMLVLLVQGSRMKRRIADIEENTRILEEQIDEEELRTWEIEMLNEYMQSDEYIEQTAKDKLGLVNDNEIIFKEAD